MNNKDLDRLFQEKLKNLEATPNARVWNNIESKLKKNKRRVVPFWWYASGVAALFILGLYLFPFSNNDDILDKNDSKIIITEAPKEAKETDVVTKNNSIIQQKNDQEKVRIVNEKRTFIKGYAKKKETLKKSDETKKLVSRKNAMKKNFLANNSLDKNEIKIANKKEIESLNNKEVTKKEKNKIIENKSLTKKVNFSKFINNKDTVIITKSKKNKWAISPVFGFLNSNSFTNTSPIEKNPSNSTTGKSSFSFGVQVGYQINKKWSIQTGIHRQQVSYTNSKVTIFPSVSSSTSVVILDNSSSFSLEKIQNQNSNISDGSKVIIPSLRGDLNQTFGYIEIPFEIKYRF